MADKNKYNEVKLALTVAKGQLTKRIKKLEESCKDQLIEDSEKDIERRESWPVYQSS